jgi:hypothetical protein
MALGPRSARHAIVPVPPSRSWTVLIFALVVLGGAAVAGEPQAGARHAERGRPDDSVAAGQTHVVPRADLGIEKSLREEPLA